MPKKATIGSIFIYAISALIIILVVYFGYRGITGIHKENEKLIMGRLQLKMKSDIGKLAINYGTFAWFSYDIAQGYERLCFVDLYIDNVNDQTTRNTTLENNYEILWDSVQSSSPNNVFAIGKNRVLAFDSGKIRVPSPFVLCINATRGMIRFNATVGGDSVMVGANIPP